MHVCSNASVNEPITKIGQMWLELALVQQLEPITEKYLSLFICIRCTTFYFIVLFLDFMA